VAASVSTRRRQQADLRRDGLLRPKSAWGDLRGNPVPV